MSQGVAGRKKILLVDDSRTILMQEQMLLGRTYEVTTASNGHEAVQKARELRPDLVLMDVVMPVMDGLDACRALREDEATSAIPVILVTTRGAHAERGAGFESGCTDYLTKPINPVDLLERIGAALESPHSPRRGSAEAA